MYFDVVSIFLFVLCIAAIAETWVYYRIINLKKKIVNDIVNSKEILGIMKEVKDESTMSLIDVLLEQKVLIVNEDGDIVGFNNQKLEMDNV